MSRQELADACNQVIAERRMLTGGGPRWAGMTASHVGSYERGEIRWPNAEYRAALCRVLGATERELGLYVDRPDRSRPMSAKTSVTADDIETLRVARTRYELMYRHVGGVPVGPRINAYLQQRVAPLLTLRADASISQELHHATAGLHSMAGICAYDAERHRDAASHFHRALRMATTAQDHALEAYVHALMANQALCLRQPHEAIRHSQAALAIGPAWLSSALRADLHVMQARSFAMISDAIGCVDQTNIALDATKQVDRLAEPAETGYIHPGLIELKSAEAMLDLGDFQTAKELANASLASGPPSPRATFHGHATLALIMSARGEYEDGLVCAATALAAAQSLESKRVHDRLRLVVRRYEPLRGSREFNEFTERARHLLSTPL